MGAVRPIGTRFITPAAMPGRVAITPVRWIGCICGKLRYTELNPVRAGLAREAEAWMWSSAAAHCGAEARSEILDLEVWRKNWTASAWRQYLAAGEMESELTEIRRCTHTGRPLGSAEFVQALEASMKRRLAPQKGGHPHKTGFDARQSELAFESE